MCFGLKSISLIGIQQYLFKIISNELKLHFVMILKYLVWENSYDFLIINILNLENE